MRIYLEEIPHIEKIGLIMTYRKTELVLFSDPESKKVQDDFNEGLVCLDAGALLLRQVDKRIGLIDAVNQCITNPVDWPLFGNHQTAQGLIWQMLAVALIESAFREWPRHLTIRMTISSGNLPSAKTKLLAVWRSCQMMFLSPWRVRKCLRKLRVGVIVSALVCR